MNPTERVDRPLPWRVEEGYGNVITFVVHHQTNGGGIGCQLRETLKQHLVEHNRF